MYRKYLNEILNYENKIEFFFSGHQLTREEIEDLKQESLCRIYESIESFRGASSLGTWIFSICKNVLYEFYRKRKKTIPIDDFEIVASDKTDFIVFDVLIQSLPEYLKPVYGKRFKMNMKIKEISQDLSMPVGTVKYYIHLIKKYISE